MDDYGRFLQGAAVGKEEQKAKTKTCFIVSAIGEANSDARRLGNWFLHIIIPVLKEAGHDNPVRSDQIDTPGMVDSQIIDQLLDADLVVADMTFLNANVFYEIGIRHSAGKPVIHMFREGIDFKIPFDVTAFRAIGYSVDQPNDLKEAADRVRRQVEAIQADDFHVDNPVVRALSLKNLRATASPAEDAILQKFEGMESRISLLEMSTGYGAAKQVDSFGASVNVVYPDLKVPNTRATVRVGSVKNVDLAERRNFIATVRSLASETHGAEIVANYLDDDGEFLIFKLRGAQKSIDYFINLMTSLVDQKFKDLGGVYAV